MAFPKQLPTEISFHLVWIFLLKNNESGQKSLQISFTKTRSRKEQKRNYPTRSRENEVVSSVHTRGWRERWRWRFDWSYVQAWAAGNAGPEAGVVDEGASRALNRWHRHGSRTPLTTSVPSLMSSAVWRSFPPVVVTRGRGGVPILLAESNQVVDLHSCSIIRLTSHFLHFT